MGDLERGCWSIGAWDGECEHWQVEEWVSPRDGLIEGGVLYWRGGGSPGFGKEDGPDE